MKKLVFDFENIGGVCRLFAIPVSSYERVRRDYVNKLNYIECKNQGDIIEIPIYADGTFYFNEDQRFETAGDSYSIEVGGVIPKLMMENADDIERLERGAWYVLSQDMNGEVRLSGDEEVKCKFMTKKSTGASAISRNQIAFAFSCTQENPSLYIKLDDMSAL